MPRAKPMTVADALVAYPELRAQRGQVFTKQAPRPNTKVFDEDGRYLGRIVEWEVSTRDPWSYEPSMQLKLADIGADYPYPYMVPAPTDEALFLRHQETASMFTTRARTNIDDELVVSVVTTVDGGEKIVYEATIDPSDWTDGEEGARKSVVDDFLRNLRAAVKD